MIIKCEYCRGEFERTVGRYNEATKKGWKQFCSSLCLARSRVNSVEGICSNPLCRKPLRRTLSQATRSALLFCSLACSAKYHNAIRQNSVRLRKCKRVGCDNYIHSYDFKVHYCGGVCSRLFNQGFSSYSPESTIAKIRLFVAKNGRIPTRNELGYLNRLARRFFGTWNKAIIAAGYDPNPVMFAKHYVARDGHKCDSLAEKIVDDWLYKKHIIHHVHVTYPWKNGMSADFVVGDLWIELFGLQGEHKRYDELKTIKLKLAEQFKIKILHLSLKDVYGSGLGKKLVRLTGSRRRPS